MSPLYFQLVFKIGGRNIPERVTSNATKALIAPRLLKLGITYTKFCYMIRYNCQNGTVQMGVVQNNVREFRKW